MIPEAKVLTAVVTKVNDIGVTATETIAAGAFRVEAIKVNSFELGYIEVERVEVGVIETLVTAIGVVELHETGIGIETIAAEGVIGGESIVVGENETELTEVRVELIDEVIVVGELDGCVLVASPLCR